ncbi:transcription termination factor NusA [Megasphaera hexanoica]|uniref:Transcription termination/antitermination protein NusA n=1 Tax=Megasphaera hexanoica TaxID=1675036 RepID=A0ABW7DR67_9FIRM|nr:MULTISPECIES: transcription termination factor NusA [Megasphaera]AXB83285.1 transcription elongation factor NusA [Megasphaera hexanoica]KUH57152.1 transcription elongation factor NusA [Megasphaera sp. DJF_B143]MCI5532383.1 transcription termination factor NusA [Caecibacter massiliensis]MDY2905154.1 transcription termination factor NusA [Caecibacter massiliensis]
MNKELLNAIAYLSKEKGVSADVICDSLEAVLITAYKKEPDANPNAVVELNRLTGDYKILAPKTVVETVEDEDAEISLAMAQILDPEYSAGDVINVNVTPKNFGRVAAQAAKQVMIQRLREAERSIVYDEFSNRQDDIITGIIQRIEQRNVYVDLGKAEAVLPVSEQIPTETYTVGQRIKCYVVEVRKTTKGAQILVSRTHPGLLKRLFELEVPEIYDGVVELKSVAREPGRRSKIAVYSRDENVDCVGACVGPKGVRVQNIVTELQNEKIDIVKWDEDPAVYIANALSPATVVSVTVDEAEKTSNVVVPDYQLSLAIGKAGQNARLAAKLTNWKIDIKSESQAAELAEQKQDEPAGEELDGDDLLADLAMPSAPEAEDAAVCDVEADQHTEE